MISDNHQSEPQGAAEPERDHTLFPKGYRRRVPGETIAEGDLVRNCMKKKSEWRPAKPGRTLWADDHRTFACPENVPVDVGVVERAMARFHLFVIENACKIENIATAGYRARYCRCCGAEGDYDAQYLYALADGLYGDGVITAVEHEEVNGATDEDEAIEAYEDMQARHSEAGEPELPPIPLSYEHTPECMAAGLEHVLRGFGEVFGTYIDTKYGRTRDVAAFDKSGRFV